MIQLADINVVFALLVENHTHHRSAWKWWAKRNDSSVAWCLPVRLGILRLLTNKTAMQGDVVTPTEALDAWGAFAQDPRVTEVSTSGPSHEITLRRLIHNRVATPNLWTDAWLASAAESSAMGLVSFDTGFRRYGLAGFELLKG